jgi:hypothetical protein
VGSRYHEGLVGPAPELLARGISTAGPRTQLPKSIRRPLAILSPLPLLLWCLFLCDEHPELRAEPRPRKFSRRLTSLPPDRAGFPKGLWKSGWAVLETPSIGRCFDPCCAQSLRASTLYPSPLPHTAPFARPARPDQISIGRPKAGLFYSKLTWPGLLRHVHGRGRIIKRTRVNAQVVSATPGDRG